MPRARTSLGEAVVQFYLKAPIAEIEQIQSTLGVIYNHRKGLADKSRQAVAAAKDAKVTGTEAKPTRKKPGPKSKAAKAQEISFGGKEVVGEAEVASA